jgi:HlyD family secretion protein
MKRLRPLIPILIIAAIVAVWWFRRDSSADVQTASGTVEATEAHLGFQVAGRVAEIHFAEGDVVREGDVLARVDLAELEALQAGAEAALAAATARLREMERGARRQETAQAEAAALAAQARAAEAEREHARAGRLHSGGAISEQALQAAATAAHVSRAASDQAEEALALVREGPRREQLDAQRAFVRSAEASVARAEATIANGTIIAPFGGRITVRHREPGETVAPGSPVLTLQNPGDRWVRIYVREDRIGAVRIGQSAAILSDTYPDREYSGEVFFIGSEAEFTPRNTQTTEERVKLVYPVKVRITGDPDFELKPGVPADVRLDGAA